MAQVTVHAPPAAMTAAGETSHSPGRLSMMNTSAPGGWSCTVPVHRYRRPGGGGKDCSTRPVMSTEGAGGDPLGMRFMSATAMLAIAATAAARSTCQRSRWCCCFLRGRVPMGHSVPSRGASGQVLGGQAAPRRMRRAALGGISHLYAWPWRAAAQTGHKGSERRPYLRVSRCQQVGRHAHCTAAGLAIGTAVGEGAPAGLGAGFWPASSRSMRRWSQAERVSSPRAWSMRLRVSSGTLSCSTGLLTGLPAAVQAGAVVQQGNGDRDWAC